jgi:hypothetical protein
MVMLPENYRAEAERMARLTSQTDDPNQRAAYREMAQSYRTRAALVEARLHRRRAG